MSGAKKTKSQTKPTVKSLETEKKTTKKTTKKVEQPKPTPEPVVVPEVVQENPLLSNQVLPSSEKNILDSFNSIVQLLNELNSNVSKAKVELKLLEKAVTREKKVLDKLTSKKNKNKGNRAPSGFVKPTKISDSLASFLGKEKGSMMARTEVTKEMTFYIKENKLQDKDNGRIIIPDSKLKKLLNIQDNETLSYFNLQKFMSPHFEKAKPVTA